MKLKHVVVLIVLASLGAIGYGYWLDESQELLANKFIGSGVVALFLLAMPLFLYKESKGKKMKDYMLTEENVRKMQGKDSENADNQ